MILFKRLSTKHLIKQWGLVTSVKAKARVVLQGTNPFVDNHAVRDNTSEIFNLKLTKQFQGFLSPSLGDYLPYSQVYHLAWAGEKEGVGRTFCILRHYLNITSLSEEEKRSIKVAACIQDTMDTTENKFVTITKKEVTEVRKQSVTYLENKQEKKTSDQSILNQMSQIVAGVTETSGDGFQAGEVVITVHKATNIEKKGLVGKADPYVVVKYANQNEKSPTVNNDHNPVWHFTSSFKMDPSDNEINIEVFDEDVGKDDFLGKAILDI